MRPKSVRAAVTLAPGNIEIREFPYPEEISTDSLLAKILMSGVCGTDHHIYSGAMPDLPWPIIQGHEPLAEVFEIGKKATTEMEVHGKVLEPGDRIVWGGIAPCGKCWYCRNLATNIRAELCDEIQTRGFPSSRTPPHLFGCFAEYTYKGPRPRVYKIPRDMPDRVAVLVDTSAAAGSGIDRALSGIPRAHEGMMWGDTAVVQGAGPVGVMAAMRFKEYGAGRVIMVGGPDLRLKLAEKFGVDETINIEQFPTSKSRIKEVLRLTDRRGADVVLEGAGVPAAFAEGIEMTRRGGIYIEMGHFCDTGSIAVNPFRICFRDMTIISQYGFTEQQYDLELKMLYKWWKESTYPIEDLVTHAFKLEETRQAIETHKSLRTMKCVIVP